MPATVDYDSDNDGYIDVDSLAKLNVIRYDLNGDGSRGSVSASDWTNYTTAFPNAATRMGCPSSGCTGYELTASLDFDSDSDGDVDANDHSGNYWNSGAGWLPIGRDLSASTRYSGDFKGNGYTVNNLFINRTSSFDQGLFGVTTAASRIETLGVTNADVTGNFIVGILVALSRGSAIVACYTTGKAQGSQRIGGLVASLNGGSIASSYSTAYVSGTTQIGGLLGYRYNGSVTNSYATGRVNRSSGTATTIGGLIGSNRATASGTVTASYWDTISSGQTASAGGSGVVGKTTRQLQTVTSYTGIYANWNSNLDGNAGNDDPWDFGSKMQYPMLDYQSMSTNPQGGQAMGASANWNAPIVGEHVGVCIAPGSGATRATVSGKSYKKAWIWERSDNGDTWEAITGTNPPTYEYTPTTSDENHFLRAKAELTDGTFAYTRALGGRVKQTSGATAGSAISFVSGNASPRVGTQIVASDPRPSGAVDARFSWQRCDNADTTYTDCEYIVGVWWTNYTPVAADVNHYLRMVVYYETSAGVWTRHATAFTGQVAASQ